MITAFSCPYNIRAAKIGDKSRLLPCSPRDTCNYDIAAAKEYIKTQKIDMKNYHFVNISLEDLDLLKSSKDNHHVGGETLTEKLSVIKLIKNRLVTEDKNFYYQLAEIMITFQEDKEHQKNKNKNKTIKLNINTVAMNLEDLRKLIIDSQNRIQRKLLKETDELRVE